MSQKYQNHDYQHYDQHGSSITHGHSCHHNHSQQKQSTLTPKSQAEQTSTVEEVVLMFRDQFGTILSQIERLFFALGHMKETEFRFHGYCRDRLVEYEPEFVALKLALSYRNISNFHADMVGTFTSKEDRLTLKLFKLIPGAFHDRVDDLQEKLGAIKQTIKPEIVALLEQVLSSLNKKTYSELNPSVVPNIKTLQQTQPTKICPQTNQDELLRRVHQIQQDQEEIAKYQRDNRGKPPPDSAFVPATRGGSYIGKQECNYIGYPAKNTNPFVGPDEIGIKPLDISPNGHTTVKSAEKIDEEPEIANLADGSQTQERNAPHHASIPAAESGIKMVRVKCWYDIDKNAYRSWFQHSVSKRIYTQCTVYAPAAEYFVLLADQHLLESLPVFL